MNIKGTYEPNPPHIRFVDDYGMLKLEHPPSSITYRPTNAPYSQVFHGRDTLGRSVTTTETRGIAPGNYSVPVTRFTHLDNAVVEIPIASLGDEIPAFDLEIVHVDYAWRTH